MSLVTNELEVLALICKINENIIIQLIDIYLRQYCSNPKIPWLNLKFGEVHNLDNLFLILWCKNSIDILMIKKVSDKMQYMVDEMSRKINLNESLTDFIGL